MRRPKAIKRKNGNLERIEIKGNAIRGSHTSMRKF
jgi:hypothetical protein